MLRSCVAWWVFALLVLVLADHPGPFNISGVSVSDNSGGVPLRREITELQAEGGAQWDVYILALDAMHNQSYTDPFSYFQLSGIHGKPFIEWNGGGEKRTDEWQGYCPHGEKLFLPWHRAFIVLFEQVLVENAMRIAQEYPESHRYQYIQAAETLRSPYWDWAADTDVPSVTVPEKVRVKIPKGDHLEEIEIENPLYTFKFPRQVLEGEYGDFDQDNRTQVFRCQSPKSYPDSANEATSSRPYKRWVYDAFTHAKNFAEFASTGDGGTSLEQIHNGIHWDGACGGQFLTSEFSGFDPLFMLHHTNVDRLWAYWQAIHPEHASFRLPYKGGARFSTPGGTIIGPDSPLRPFFKSETEFHSTRSVEKISDFGYAYQGLEYWEKSEAQMKVEAKILINQLYGPTDTNSGLLPRQDVNGTIRYFANIQLEASEVERPCVVELFIGDVRAGSMFVMENPAKGFVHAGFRLDNTLEVAGMRDLLVADTLNTIQSSLQVSIVKVNGDAVPVSATSSLEIEIEHVIVKAAMTADELPVYGFSRRRKVPARQKDTALFV